MLNRWSGKEISEQGPSESEQTKEALKEGATWFPGAGVSPAHDINLLAQLRR